MSKLDFLEKIANQVLDEAQMNPDPAPQMSEEEVQELQTGQDSTPQALSDEEAALKQQLDAEIAQDQEAAEEEREHQHALVDRALLEGAAEEAVKEMEDEEIKDMLLDKAASELITLGTFANLVDLATSDSDDALTKVASDTLEYMSQSSHHFQEGLSKVASEMYHPDNVDQINDLFSHDGISYTFEQLAKLNNYDDLNKVANDEDVEALATIVENEGDELLEAQEIVGEAYEEALKELAKEDIKEAILEGGEYDEGQAAGMLATASLGMSGLYKEANEVARKKSKKPESKYKPKNKPKKMSKKKLAALGLGTLGVGGSGLGLAHHLNNQKSDEVSMEQLASHYLREAEMYKQASGGRFGKVGEAFGKAGETFGRGMEYAKNNKGKVGAGLAATGAVGLGGAALNNRRKKKKNEQQAMEQLAHQFLDEVEMYKQASGGRFGKVGETFGRGMEYAKNNKGKVGAGLAATGAVGLGGAALNNRRKKKKNEQQAMEQLAHQFLDEVEMYKQADGGRFGKVGETFGRGMEYAKNNKGKVGAGLAATGAVGLGGAALNNRRKKKKNEQQAMEQLAHQFLDEVEMYKQAAGGRFGKVGEAFGKAGETFGRGMEYAKNNKGKVGAGLAATGAVGLGGAALNNRRKKKKNEQQAMEQLAHQFLDEVEMYKQAAKSSDIYDKDELKDKKFKNVNNPNGDGFKAKAKWAIDKHKGKIAAGGAGLAALGTGGYAINKRRKAKKESEGNEKEASIGMSGLYKQAGPFKGAYEAVKEIPGNMREGFRNMKDLRKNLSDRQALDQEYKDIIEGTVKSENIRPANELFEEMAQLDKRIRSGRNTAVGTGLGALGVGGAGVGAGAYALNKGQGVDPEELQGEGMEQVAHLRRYYA